MDARGPARIAAMTADFELQIDSIAAGGDGVGRHEGMVVFVPRTAPGDRVLVRAAQHDRLMRGQVLQVLQPSPQRTEPPCEHYTRDRCGGCQVQHIQYAGQLLAKAGIIRDSLTRIGRLQVEAPPVEASDRPWRYRRKLTLAMRRRDSRWISGLHRYDAPGDVFDLRDCPITQEAVMQCWATIMAHAELLPNTEELRAAVRALTGGFSFTVEGAKRWSDAAAFFAAVPELLELWWIPEHGKRRLLHSRTSPQAGASFTQVNPDVAAALRGWVVSLATQAQPRSAVDAYAGTGDVAVELAATGIPVIAIEVDREAAMVCASRLPAGSRAIASSVERALPGALPADLVVLNPPRAGLDSKVADTLRSQPHRPHLVYVSCNPATLARDVRRLDNYRIKSLRGFDMFPQTAHVETVCVLEPAA